MPVLPLVASTIVVRPGSMMPSASAASIIATPIRSFTDPPGLSISSLANSSAPSGAIRVSWTIGVRPTWSAMLIGIPGIRAVQPIVGRHRDRAPAAMSGSYMTFAARRVVAAFLIAVLVSAVTFVMLHVLRPESFFDPRALPVQLVDYLWHAFTRFALGQSYQPPFRPVSDLIRERIGADLSLFVGAAVFGVVAGVGGGGGWARPPPAVRPV